MKIRISFMAQDDVLYPHLTVIVTLFFNSLLGFPKNMTRDKKVQHVEHVTNELGLTRWRNDMISGSLFREISVGRNSR